MVISRIDLIGKDAIVLRDGHQVTEFREAFCPGRYKNPTALVFDEYDAGRPDVMFCNASSRLKADPFRPEPLCAKLPSACSQPPTRLVWAILQASITAQQINQGQMDRWNIVCTLNYLPHDSERQSYLPRPRLRRRQGAVERHS